jgi:hypothetical protein
MNSYNLSEEDLAELTRLEESMWREATRFDLTFQETRFAPDFTEFGRSGRVYSRQDMVLTDAQPIQAVLPLSNLRFRLLDENIAQVTYNSQVTYDGAVEYGRRSSIWFRTSSGWVMRFHQGTPYVP